MYFALARSAGEQNLDDAADKFTKLAQEHALQAAFYAEFCGRYPFEKEELWQFVKGLTPVDGIDVNSPAIKEIPLTLECKVIYKQEQEHDNVPQDLYEKFYKNTPSSDGTRTNDDYHTVYYGEIVNAYIVE